MSDMRGSMFHEFVGTGAGETESPDTDMRPCPFCGWDDPGVNFEQIDETTRWYEVKCFHCDIEGPGGNSPWEAVRRWNTRDNVEMTKAEWFTLVLFLTVPILWITACVCALCAAVFI